MQCVRVKAFVTFHYRLENMPFLDRVLRNLADFDVRRMHVTVVTSTEDGEEQALLEKLCRNYFETGDFAIEAFPNCQPGFLLTWKHKPLLRAAAADPAGGFSHFLYVEDDIGLTYRNFQYFTEHAEALRELGLIPSFVRTEFMDGTIRSCDAIGPSLATPLVKVFDCTFAPPAFPFCACFIMDRLLVSEYLSSRSFDYDRSREVSFWGIPERAAMGLCWENPPPGFSHRYVVPIHADLRPLACCQVPHMPAKYAPMPDVCFGKRPVESLFVPPA